MAISLTSVITRRRLGRVPFTVGLGGLLAGGMVGLLALNISIQSGSAELRRDQSQAQALSDEAAALRAEVDRVGSATSLAQQATALGMRPNPYGVFLNLADGSVTGDPVPVRGDEVPALVPTDTKTADSPIKIKIYPVPTLPATPVAGQA